MSQKTLNKWLKLVIIGFGAGGLILYFAALPFIGISIVEDFPESSYCFWPWLIFLWLTAVPVYLVLFFLWKVVKNIQSGQSFSAENAKYFKWNAKFTMIDTCYFFIGNIALLFANCSHPSVFLASLVVCFIGTAVSVIFATLSHLFFKASILQSQNDLTI